MRAGARQWSASRYSRLMSTAMASCSGTSVQGQVVLVLQGGGALGAYQVGVYQALHEAGLEPDWVIGTSIGAINGALLAGNRHDERLARLAALWAKLRLSPMLALMAAPCARPRHPNLPATPP